MRRLLLPLAALLICAMPVGLQQQIRRLQASFVANFPAFVRWPPSSFQGHPKEIRVGLIGPNPLTKAGRQYLHGRVMNGKKFILEQIHPNTKNFEGFQILYIEGLSKKETTTILKSVAKKPILTAGLEENFLQMGGIVNFQIQGQAVRFFVSYENGKRAGLKLAPNFAKYGRTKG